MNKQQTFNYHENIIPDNQVQNFLNELGALQGGIKDSCGSLFFYAKELGQKKGRR